MELTPIKVKGKGGGQKKTWRPPAPQRAAKRPRDEAEGDDAGDDRRRRRRFRSKRPAAPAEELPTEILETIILMSQNLNFLRSSLRIGYRFSSPSFLTELLKAAFEPTWQMWLGYHRARIPFKVYTSKGGPDRYRIPGDPDFQSAVLACKWANATMLLDAQQKWYRRNGGPGSLEVGVRHSSPAGHGRPRALRPYLAQAADLATRFEEDWESYSSSCIQVLMEGSGLDSPGDEHPELYEPEYVDLHHMVIVPARLVSGPFDLETARTLFWLVRGGSRLASSSWEWTKRGYDQIMSLDDKRLAVILLMMLKALRAFVDWPKFLLEQELRRADQEMERISRQPGDTDTLALDGLWCCAYGVMERSYQLDSRGAGPP